MDDERAEAQALILGALERMGRLIREMSQVVAREHTSTRATMAIARLLDSVGEVGVGEVAEALRVDMSVASRQVSDLVTAGLVERTVANGDRRVRQLRLTAAGRVLAEDLHVVMHRVADETFADWSPEDLHDAAATLDRLVTSLAGSVGCSPHAAALHRGAAPELREEMAAAPG